MFVMKQKDISSAKRLLILDAASRVVLDKGASALTLESVAEQAGISKGGLLYHFPNKESLIAGMIERLIAEFDDSLERELSKNDGDWLAAYIRASFEVNPERERISCALCAVIATNPSLLEPLQARFAEWQAKAASTSISPEIGTIVRLALDGMWLSDLLGFSPPTPEIRGKVLRTLLKLASGSI